MGAVDWDPEMGTDLVFNSLLLSTGQQQIGYRGSKPSTSRYYSRRALVCAIIHSWKARNLNPSEFSEKEGRAEVQNSDIS